MIVHRFHRHKPAENIYRIMLCYIGVGSNVGARLKYIEDALALLDQIPRIAVQRISPIYETEPVGGPGGQGDYLNCVLEISTDMNPRELLSQLQDVETRAGRIKRQGRWSPREIDLDILLCGDLIVQEKDLVIPHPSMHERLFVLKPLADLTPEIKHPVLNLQVSAILEGMSLKGRWRKIEETLSSR